MARCKASNWRFLRRAFTFVASALTPSSRLAVGSFLSERNERLLGWRGPSKRKTGHLPKPSDLSAGSKTNDGPTLQGSGASRKIGDARRAANRQGKRQSSLR